MVPEREMMKTRLRQAGKANPRVCSQAHAQGADYTEDKNLKEKQKTVIPSWARPDFFYSDKRGGRQKLSI